MKDIRQENETTQSCEFSFSTDVELLLGPYRCGKTVRLIADLLDLKASAPFSNVLVLVPSARYGRIFKDRVHRALRERASRRTGQAVSGLFGLAIQPFYQACLSIVSDSRGEPRIIPEEIRPHLLANILSQMKAEGQLNNLSRIAAFHGTSASVLELIDEFQRAGLSPADLQARLEQSSCSESHLFELANIYARYFSKLKELEFYDQKSLALSAREVLFAASSHTVHPLEQSAEVSHSVQRWEHTEVVSPSVACKDLKTSHSHSSEYDLIAIDGFDRISHLQAQVFAGFARRARQTRISFDYLQADPSDSDSPSFTLRQRAEDYRWKDSSYIELLTNLSPRLVHFATNTSAADAGGTPAFPGSSPQDIETCTANLAKVIPEPGSAAVPAASTPPRSLDPNSSLGSVIHPGRAGGSPASTCPKIEAVSLLDQFLEMVEVAREIKSSLKSRKLHFEDLIVVTRSPESYRGAIESAFEDAGIPYFIDGSSKLGELAPWQFILKLLTLNTNDFRRKDLIDLLRSPYINLEALKLSARDVSTLDRESYSQKLIGGISSWQKFLSADNYAPVSASIMQMLMQLKHNDEPASASFHASKIEDIIDKYMIFPGSNSELKSIEAISERESIKALRRILKVLIMEENLLPQEAESFSDFWKRFEKLADNSNYARPRPETPAVTICSAELVPNILFKEIYICGLVEGEFPRHQKSKGFLSRDEIQQWFSFGIDIRNPRQEAGFERALFYSLAERCSQRLYLSFAQFSGKKSDETIPSFYLGEVLEGASLTLKRMKPFQVAQQRPSSVRDALAQSLWYGSVNAADTIAEKHEAVAYRWQNLKPALASTLSRETLQHENLFNGYLAELFSVGALSFPAQETWTATKINDYGKCPFRFWASHILSLRPREEAEPGLNFALVGQFYHKVLELFFSALNNQRTEDPNSRTGDPNSRTGDPNSQTWRKTFETSFSNGLEWLEKRADFQPSPYWQQEKKALHFRLKKFVEKELRRLDTSTSLFEPRMFEVNFGTKSPNSFPPLLLKDKSGKEITISGCIDRVDLELRSDSSQQSARGKRARIVDYKSGSKRISPKEAELGRNLQLPVYALALEQCILPDHRVGEADYLSINAALSVGHLNFDAEKQSELKDHARELVAEYASAANNGIFTVKPNGQVACSDCNHASVCRVKELSLQLEEEENAFSD